MPVYEYRCPACRKRTSVLYRSFARAEESSPRCPSCGEAGLTRLISRVAVHRSEEDLPSSLEDMSDVDENDPRSMARWLRRAGSELGEEAGPEFQETVERLEAGESPEDLEGDGDGLTDDEEDYDL